jgi:hypothetical protein
MVNGIRSLLGVLLEQLLWLLLDTTNTRTNMGLRAQTIKQKACAGTVACFRTSTRFARVSYTSQ